MTVVERQEQIIGDYAPIEDPYERFQLIVETATTDRAAISEANRCEANLVPGCTSRVYLVVSRLESGNCSVQIESNSPALDAIAALFCRLYHDAPDQEIIDTEPIFLQRLGVDRQLTPTRRRGLSNLRKMLVERVQSLSESGQ